MSIKSKVGMVRTLAGALRDAQARDTLFRSIAAHDRSQPAECACCGYVGKFSPAGRNVRIGALCPSCHSYERHRVIARAFARGFLGVAGKDVLHFAPEKTIRSIIMRGGPASYRTADIRPGRADLVLDLEQIDRPPESFDIVIASHVLEHVDDRKALAEIYRILRAGGNLIALVPLVEGWNSTYEDATITKPLDRDEHFGRHDHVRFYGADFRDRVKQAGFNLAEFTAGPEESVRYRLTRGEKVFLASKPR